MTASVESSAPDRLPLLFSFQSLVAGNGFIAQVSMDGRALLELEDDEVWITGVAPVGWTEGGQSRGEAFQNFRRGWELLIDHFARAAEDSAAFEAALLSFANVESEALAHQWEAAREELRLSEFRDPQLETKPAALKAVELHIRVIESPSEAKPELNSMGTGYCTAA